MLKSVDETLTDADVVLYVTELADRTINEDLQMKLRGLKVPLFVVINKIDLGGQEELEEAVSNWEERLKPQRIIPVSALHHFGQDELIENILNVLPESPPYFSKDDSLSDRTLRFFVSDIIREKILSTYQKEIPYSSEVQVIDYKESEEIDRIYAVIYVARESQKAIILGHQGKAIRKLGTESRKRIEEFIGKHVYLDLTVKVLDDWRNNERSLKELGYE